MSCSLVSYIPEPRIIEAKTKEQLEAEKKKLLKKVETIEKKITDLNRPQPIGFRFGTKSNKNG